jgi:ankyrin repeat protein
MIAWNGYEEIILLTTDLHSSEPTKVLEVIPLPSEPEVKKGDIEVLQRVTEIINKRLAKLAEARSKRKGKEAPEMRPAGEITFNEQIGAHDISVAHVLNSNGFIDWVDNYLKSSGVENPKIPEELKTVIAEYLEEGFGWFVFDVVQLEREPKTNEAIQYRFRTDFLYYPLKITRTLEGNTTIDLLVLTPETKNKYVFTGFPRYRIRYPHRPIYLTNEELRYIDDELYDLFRHLENNKAWLSIWQIEGELSSFRYDLILMDLEELEEMVKVFDAVGKGDTETVKRLLDTGVYEDVIDARDSMSMTALMRAASYGHSEIAHLLLEAGAAVNATDKLKWTALMVAAEGGHIEFVKLLLDEGIDVNAVSNDGRTALMIALMYGSFDFAQLLLEARADVNAQDKDRRTALMFASEKRHPGIVKSLIEAGAYVNAQSNNGYTVLMSALWLGNEEVIRLLLEAGANVNASDDDGNTALIKVSGNGYRRICKLLIEAGADVNAQNENGRTALIFASEKKHPETVKLLIEEGADVNAQDEEGHTALMYAKERGYKEIVQLLNEADAK